MFNKSATVSDKVSVLPASRKAYYTYSTIVRYSS